MPKIYILYSHQDQNIVTEVARHLSSIKDNKVFIDTEILIPGTSWEEALREAQEESEIIVIFISKNYLNSIDSNNSYLSYELESSLDEFYKKRKYIIPVIIDETEHQHLPNYIQQIIYIRASATEKNSPVELSTRLQNAIVRLDIKKLKRTIDVDNQIINPTYVSRQPVSIVNIDIKNIGIIKHATLTPAPRFNLITGDNGIGKSFLLDIIWWVCTSSWPAEANSSIGFGRKIQPQVNQASKITSNFSSGDIQIKIESEFIHSEQTWNRTSKNIIDTGIIIYAQVDGSYALWDPARNGHLESDVTAYVFNPSEVYNGLIQKENILCNGLIRDWSSWQKEKGTTFSVLESAINFISPNPDEILSVGDLMRVFVEDVRDIPVIRMHGGDVPIIFSPASIRRIISLVYLIIWSWQEHQRACEIRHLQKSKKLLLLLDEIESHLHPRWQKTILKSIQSVISSIAPEISVQIIATTHSPLVMASIEPFFDPEQDAWFDLDLTSDGHVEVKKQPWYRRGDSDAWLKSEAFDQKSGYAPEIEQIIEQAANAMQALDFNAEKAREIDIKLRSLLSESDPFLRRWDYIARKKEWTE